MPGEFVGHGPPGPWLARCRSVHQSLAWQLRPDEQFNAMHEERAGQGEGGQEEQAHTFSPDQWGQTRGGKVVSPI